MLGSTRRSGYPSDSSRRRRSQRVDGLTVTPTPATRRPHRPGPGTGLAAPPGRCHQWVTQTGARALPPTATPPPSPARAGDWPCRPARTVQAAGVFDWSPRLAGDGDPPPSPARAGDWPCRPARTVQAAGDSDRGRRRRSRRPHQSGPGTGHATPPGRCSDQRSACHWQTRIRAGRLGPHGRRLPPAANRRSTRRDLAALQSTGPLPNLGGRRPTCKGHAPTYSLFTVSGR